MADQQIIEQPKSEFDSAAHIQKANEREALAKNGKAPQPEVRIEQPKPEDGKPHLTARDRRTQNRLREELGEERGRRLALEEILHNGAVPASPQTAKPADDPEPKREQFKTDAEYNRALGRWDARQEVKTVVSKAGEEASQAQQRAEWEAHVRKMDEKFSLDKATIPDWNETLEIEDEVKWSPDEHPTLMGLIHSSDSKAFVLHYLKHHQDELQRFLDLTKTPGEQIRQFARLEGRIEKLYTSSDGKEVVQASGDKTRKERTTHPAEGQPGRNSAESESGKPRPSTEVAARGGSAPPEKPAIGSPQWMAERNRQQHGR